MFGRLLGSWRLVAEIASCGKCNKTMETMITLATRTEFRWEHMVAANLRARHDECQVSSLDGLTDNAGVSLALPDGRRHRILLR